MQQIDCKVQGAECDSCHRGASVPGTCSTINACVYEEKSNRGTSMMELICLSLQAMKTEDSEEP